MKGSLGTEPARVGFDDQWENDQVIEYLEPDSGCS